MVKCFMLFCKLGMFLMANSDCCLSKLNLITTTRYVVFNTILWPSLSICYFIPVFWRLTFRLFFFKLIFNEPLPDQTKRLRRLLVGVGYVLRVRFGFMKTCLKPVLLFSCVCLFVSLFFLGSCWSRQVCYIFEASTTVKLPCWLFFTYVIFKFWSIFATLFEYDSWNWS